MLIFYKVLTLSLMTLWSITPSVVTIATTPLLPKILLERCHKFQKDVDNINVKCSSVVQAFLDVVSNRDPCAAKAEDFKTFLDIAMKQTPKDKVTFWSGLKEFIEEYSTKLGLKALETGTLPGYMLNSLNFCGKIGDGLNYERCPDWGDCFETHVEVNYWKALSTRFAQLAKGNVHVMVNAAKRPAIRDRSFLKTVELPEMTLDNVKSLKVILISPPNTPDSEPCHERPSIAEFGRLVVQKGIQYSCEGPIPAEKLFA